MPTTYTKYPVETERKDPGIGGKPPVDRRPTGGGGSGDDDDQWNRTGRGGPRETLKRFRMMVFLILACDMMFFMGVAVLFYAHQGVGHLDTRTPEFIGDWHPVQLPPILFLNTAVLILSSLTVEIARRHIFHELDVVEEWLGMGRPALYRALPWLGATLILGGLFVAGQWEAWRQLTHQGYAFDGRATPAIYFFYIITGLHALHLLIGVAALVLCLCALHLLRKVEYRQIAVDGVSWYWHAMGLAWILLFALLGSG
jgi:cytochrome c oxidase subunit 3